MLDQAGIQIAQGKTIACERTNGVNDNMKKSHFHDYYELYYLEEGVRYHVINDELYLLHANELILFAPHVMHRSYGDADVPFQRTLAYFVPDEINSPSLAQLLLTKTGAYRLDSNSIKQIHPILNQMLAEQSTDEPFSQEYIHNLLNLLLIEIVRLNNKVKKSEKSNRMTNVLSYIHEHYNDELTVELLAEEAYISQYHLCREFKRFTNSTIVQYINTTRIMNAQRMILETDKSYTQISADTGFSNVTHFNRVFKQILGQSPSEYKRSAAQHILR